MTIILMTQMTIILMIQVSQHSNDYYLICCLCQIEYTLSYESS